ncbi:DHA1 family tetracycline resistance protein-like MFS transporter [Variovorax boronicumulans]|uniref:TCR/Tet family MFS transporter n=1 Tax=Variovorax boronicumulans TaxID=436515 RepID=UPI0027814F01|nr:TCR/Tet family MFS transporter [Variovorax boronicumulans]MDQ0013868.1 DHA1 family tetracycline resistance protein-like MFS transporter [Variovorax boronicumulans]
MTPSTLPAPRVRRAALAFIFVTVLIDFLAFGLILPGLPHLVERLAGGSTATAAYWIAVFGTAFAAIQFVSSPIQGALSDRFGRRPVILLSCLGLGVDFVFMALADSLPWLFVGRVVSGVFSASFTIANAYIADVTPPEDRARSYGIVGAAFGMGLVFGPVLGGQLSHIDPRLPFWFAAGLTLLSFCYGWFVLPESLPPERRARKFDWSHANPLGSLLLLKRYPQVFGLAAVIFLVNLAQYVYPSVFVLFADYRYHWKEDAVGWVLGAVGVLSVLVNALLIGPGVKRLGERRALLFGMGFGVLGFVVIGFADAGWMLLAALPFGTLLAFAGPAAQALVTREVGAGEQGRIQGALTSLVSVAGIVGPAMFAGSFGYFIGADAPVHLPGAPFFIAAVFLCIGALIAWRCAQPKAAVAAVPELT